MKKIKIVLILLIIFQINSVFAQRDWLKKADALYYGEAYFDAVDLYKKAYTQKKLLSEKARILYQIGDCYRMQHDISQAMIWYKKALKADYKNPDLFVNIAICLKQSGECGEAEKLFAEHSSEITQKEKYEPQISGCAQVKEWTNTKSKYQVIPEIFLNSPYYDFGPQIVQTSSKTIMYFSSTRDESKGDRLDPRVGQNFTDIYFTQQDPKGKWSVPLPISEAINSDMHEGSIALSKDGKELYFTRCPFTTLNNWGCDIYYSKKRGSSWTDPVVLELREEGDDTTSYRHPTLFCHRGELKLAFPT